MQPEYAQRRGTHKIGGHRRQINHRRGGGQVVQPAPQPGSTIHGKRQLPGNTDLQPREAKLSSQNTAQMMPFLKQNHGKASGNAWGPAVSMLRTINEEVYYFNFHDPEKGTDSTGKDIPGITFITGSTGTGKTVLLSNQPNFLSI